MKNRDLIDALSKLPLDIEVYLSTEPANRPTRGHTLLASAISKVDFWEDGQLIVISPVPRRPKSFTRKGKPHNPTARHNRN
jgi:hypothetical protein